MLGFIRQRWGVRWPRTPAGSRRAAHARMHSACAPRTSVSHSAGCCRTRPGRRSQTSAAPWGATARAPVETAWAAAPRRAGANRAQTAPTPGRAGPPSRPPRSAGCPLVAPERLTSPTPNAAAQSRNQSASGPTRTQNAAGSCDRVVRGTPLPPRPSRRRTCSVPCRAARSPQRGVHPLRSAACRCGRGGPPLGAKRRASRAGPMTLRGRSAARRRSSRRRMSRAWPAAPARRSGRRVAQRRSTPRALRA
mmetsp:Transcript_19542/g.58213  ORF Transcript_19542/g.58213 Transcript_19542/m.58213 type:complete len:250 (+) Transcript_19542:265-1014(+)